VTTRVRRPGLLVLCAFDSRSTFSYHTAWPRQLAGHPSVNATVVNLASGARWAKLRAASVIAGGTYDAVVLLHSAFSNAQLLDGVLLDLVRRRSQPKIFFIGNEYKLMAEKMAFAESLPVALLISQSSSPQVHDLYRRRLGCKVAGIPNTGLDSDLFVARTPRRQRPIDLGYRAVDGPAYLGHQERREIAEYFTATAERYGLVVDISMDVADRFDEPEWAGFLDRCKGQLGAEAGFDYFELDDRTRNAVLAFEAANPGATFEEIHQRFFAGYGPSVPMRIISGRQIEAAGTRTVQILFEGRYDGYFQPDVHFIPLKKDLSNGDDAIRKFRDEALCDELTGRAHAVAVEQLSYQALIAQFLRHLEAVL
jgi:hypothetical protein